MLRLAYPEVNLSGTIRNYRAAEISNYATSHNFGLTKKVLKINIPVITGMPDMLGDRKDD